MFKILEDTKKTNSFDIVNISQNISNKISKKIIVGSLAMSFMASPTGTASIINTTNIQYKNVNGIDSENNTNTFMLSGHKLEDKNNDSNIIKLIYNSGVKTEQISYNNIINLYDKVKDVDSMLAKRSHNIKGKVQKSSRASGTIVDANQTDNNLIRELHDPYRKSIKIKGKITSAKRASNLLA